MPKRTIVIIISVIVILAIAIGIGIYFAVKTTQQVPGVLSPSTGLGGLVRPPVKLTIKPKLEILSDQPALFYWTAGDAIYSVDSSTGNQKTSTSTAQSATSTQAISEKQILYFNEKGQILRVKDKEDEIVSGRQISDIQNIKFSKDGSMAIVKYGIADSFKFEIFNVATKVWQALDNITAVDFSPNNLQIAYFENAKNSTANNLVIKDLTGKQKATIILTFNQKDFDLKWVDTDKILLVSKPSANYQNEIWAASVKNKTLTLFSRDTGLIINWAKDLSYGLKFTSNEMGVGELNLLDKNGTIKANLNFKTMPEKCAVTISKIYCAVPYDKTSVKEPFLPDDYLKRAVYFSDFIYEIDINSNTLKTLLDQTEPALDAFNLSLSGNQILFINRYDNKIYGLNL